MTEKAPEIIEKFTVALIENAPKVAEAGWEIDMKLAEAIIKNASLLSPAAALLQATLSNDMADTTTRASGWGQDLVENLASRMTSRLGSLRAAASSLASTIRSYLHFTEPDEGPLADFHTYAPDMMDLFAQGIRENENMLRSQIADSFDFGELISPISMRQAQTEETFTTPAHGFEERDTGTSKALTVILELNKTELARAVYQLNKDETQRVGVNLADVNA